MSVEEDLRTMTDEVTKDDAPAGTGPPATVWRFATAVLGVLLVGALVGCFLLWQDRAESEDLVEAEKAATHEAERIVVAWLTYDYRDDPDDQAWVTESGTDEFQERYERDALNRARERIVGERRFVSRGRAVDSAATAEDVDHVKVLVFTDQTVTDKEIRRQGGEALHARSGVELSMVREDGEWLVDELVQLQFQ